MKIIRDEEMGGLFMIPLLVDWGIKRCNVKGCTNKPNTIATQLGEDIPISGFCEEHYQKANTPDGTRFDMEWDDFDAFASHLEEAEQKSCKVS